MTALEIDVKWLIIMPLIPWQGLERRYNYPARAFLQHQWELPFVLSHNIVFIMVRSKCKWRRRNNHDDRSKCIDVAVDDCDDDIDDDNVIDDNDNE